MASDTMVLKIVLPLEILFEKKGVTRLVVDTTTGSMGFLPLRLDCVALIVPGILTYEAQGEKEGYAAIDRGLLVKTGPLVTLAVRDGIVGGNLGQLREIIENKFLRMSAEEQEVRNMLAQLEGAMIRRSTKGYRGV